jgi:hypothetical protein
MRFSGTCLGIPVSDQMSSVLTTLAIQPGRQGSKLKLGVAVINVLVYQFDIAHRHGRTAVVQHLGNALDRLSRLVHGIAAHFTRQMRAER